MYQKSQNSYIQRQLQTAAKWLVYLLILYAGYILQVTPGAFALWGIKPVWVVGVCVAVSCKEDKYSAAFFAVVGGLLWDIAAGRIAGFFAILLLLGCFVTGVLFEGYFRESRLNIALLSAGVCAMVLLADLLFIYILPGVSGSAKYFFLRLLPTVFYTGIAGMLCFYPVRFCHRKFKVES